MKLRTLTASVAATLTFTGTVAAVAYAPPPSQLCNSGSHYLESPESTTRYQIRPNFWKGTGPTCIAPVGGSGFRVLQTPAPTRPHEQVTTYPDVFAGCTWNVCSRDSNLPIQVPHLKWAVTSWSTSQHASGTWNAAYDLWMTRHYQTQGHADGAEIMIWLNHVGGCCWIFEHPAQYVTLDGIRFLVQHSHAVDSLRHAAWNYVQFRMLTTRTSVTRLFLGVFIRYCLAHHLIRPSWWLEDVEAGFEIWHGGVGLATNSFALKVQPK
jgi:cellulose 1,4-beta-cellobiosidase